MKRLFCSPLLALAVGLGSTVALAQDRASTREPAPPPLAAPEQPAQPAPVAPAGQWVSTNQYGWVWMPYAQTYTYVDANADVAYMYLYSPAFGWRWRLSPWIIGVGPEPYWGVRGRVGFAWYAHPWFHRYYAAPRYGGGRGAPGFGHYGPGVGHGFHGGGHHR